jgi:hypothetical protein
MVGTSRLRCPARAERAERKGVCVLMSVSGVVGVLGVTGLRRWYAAQTAQARRPYQEGVCQVAMANR